MSKLVLPCKLTPHQFKLKSRYLKQDGYGAILGHILALEQENEALHKLVKALTDELERERETK